MLNPNLNESSSRLMPLALSSFSLKIVITLSTILFDDTFTVKSLFTSIIVCSRRINEISKSSINRHFLTDTG